jgi:hypothetical protein
MPLELTLAYFTPIITFLLVFTLVYAFLAKTKVLGENASVNAFVGFISGLIFILAPLARKYTLEVVPWLTVLIILLFFFILIITFIHSNFEAVLKNKLFTAAVILVLLAIFLVSSLHVFGPLVKTYAGALGINLGEVRDLILQPAVLGVLLLFVIAAVLSWFFQKK